MFKRSGSLRVSQGNKSALRKNSVALETRRALAGLRAGGKPGYENLEDYFAEMDRRTSASWRLQHFENFSQKFR